MAILSANEVHYSYKSKYQTVHAVRGVTYNLRGLICRATARLSSAAKPRRS